MKFGKDLKKQMVPEWTEAYMDYSGLKSILRQISSYKQQRRSKQPSKSSLHNTNNNYLHPSFSGLNRQPTHYGSSGGSGSSNIEAPQVIEVNTYALQQQRKDDSSSHSPRVEFYETEFLAQSEDGGDKEAAFFRKLDQELNKVNTFYKDRVDEVMDEANSLNKQMDALIALRIKVENPPALDAASHYIALTKINQASSQNQATKQGGEEPANDPEAAFPSQTNHHVNDFCKEESNNTDDEDPQGLGVLDRVKINNTLESPLSTLKGVFKDSKHDELSFNKDELKEAEERLKHAHIDFFRKLRVLQHYRFMNLSAFSRILNKYEEITSRRASRSYMKLVEDSYLGSSEEIYNLLEIVEATYIKHFASSNRRKGIKSLKPKTKKEKHSVTFFSGFFSGCSIALVIAIVLRIVTRNLIDKKEGISYMVDVFPLYSVFGYIVLHLLTFTADLYFWRRYRINYPFIFGFKHGTELGYREAFLLSAGLAVVTLSSFLANLHMDLGTKSHNYKTLTELFPLALVVIVLVILLCPFNILCRSSRFFFIKSLFRCICAPLYKVTLADFILADNLTSQVQAIRSLDLYICYYGLEFSQRQNKCHKHGVYNALYFIVAVIPFWIRFLQCLRRLWEDKDWMHGYNGLKYFVTIVAVLMRTASEMKKGKMWMVFGLMSSIAATIMNTYWDIVMDWGLLRIHSNNIYLRERLLVPYKAVYFAAMVLNVLLRIAWMQQVLEFKLQHSLDKLATTTIISCLEILRRGIWTFFRVENEHLNNVGKYRAFKSVPLPFNFDEQDPDKDE